MEAPRRLLALSFVFLCLMGLTVSDDASNYGGDLVDEPAKRENRFLSMFEIVNFPNDECDGDSKNGTCYTSSECEKRNGDDAGSCASGYGVCCTFKLGCGDTSSENITYFESSGSDTGDCSIKICPCDDNICQLRLDFNTFQITGPSTSQTTVKALMGAVNAMGAEVTEASRCLTDSFTVTNPGGTSPPVICGVNNGEHMYVPANQNCNDLAMQLGTSTSTRQWNIAVTQLECTHNNLAPPGCTQWFYGGSTGKVRSFNYDSGNGFNLAAQNQVICIRREKGSEKICWTTATAAGSDFEVSGMGTDGKVKDACCGYGADGKNTATGYDCVVIPDAEKVGGTILANKAFCGVLGLVTVDGTTTATVCSKSQPFKLEFISDEWESLKESQAINKGFELCYIQS